MQNLKVQDDLLTRRMGTAFVPRTYDSVLFEISECATILDDRYAKSQAKQRQAKKAEQDKAKEGGSWSTISVLWYNQQERLLELN